jgi:hypothetical protein
MNLIPHAGRSSFTRRILVFIFLVGLSAPLVQGADPEETLTPTASPTGTPVPAQKAVSQIQGSSNVLVLHKPLLPAAWGEVIQYRRDTPHSLFDRDRETLHEFVLRGPNGVLRVAFYHEPQEGDGFWEVWVWDQP